MAKRKKPPGYRDRERILGLDVGEDECPYCRKQTAEFTVDHIIPKSDIGCMLDGRPCPIDQPQHQNNLVKGVACQKLRVQVGESCYVKSAVNQLLCCRDCNQSKADIPFGDFVSSKGISLANRIPAFLQEGAGALNQPLGNITELTMPAPPHGIRGWDPHPDSNLFIPRTIVPGPDVDSSMVLRLAPTISDFDVDRGFYANFLGFEKAGNAVRLYFAFIRHLKASSFGRWTITFTPSHIHMRDFVNSLSSVQGNEVYIKRNKKGHIQVVFDTPRP